jgi:pimeloyl-ACP methyl ester carboxylesterase
MYSQLTLFFPDVLDQAANWEYDASKGGKKASFCGRIDNFLSPIFYTPMANRLQPFVFNKPLPPLDDELITCARDVKKIHFNDQHLKLILVAHGFGALAATRYLQLNEESCSAALFINPILRNVDSKRKLMELVEEYERNRIRDLPLPRIEKLGKELKKWDDEHGAELTYKIYKDALAHWDEFNGEISSSISLKIFTAPGRYPHLTNMYADKLSDWLADLYAPIHLAYRRETYPILAKNFPDAILSGGGRQTIPHTHGVDFDGFWECRINHLATIFPGTAAVVPDLSEIDKVCGVMRYTPGDIPSTEAVNKVIQRWIGANLEYSLSTFQLIAIGCGTGAPYAIRLSQLQPRICKGVLLIDPIFPAGFDPTLEKGKRVVIFKTPNTDQKIVDILSTTLTNPPDIRETDDYIAGFDALFNILSADYNKGLDRDIADDDELSVTPPEISGGSEDVSSPMTVSSPKWIIFVVCLLIIIVLILIFWRSKAPPKLISGYFREENGLAPLSS